MLISNLLIRLGVNTKRLEEGFKRAEKRTKMLRDKIRGTFSGMAGMLGVGIGVGAFVASIKRQMSAIDALAKKSDQLGIPIERFQELQHAAELTGAGADTLSAGLATLQKRLGESARRGSGPAKEALDELGLSVEALVKMNPAEQFSAIAGAMDSIEDPARKNAIAANLFSKANMSLVNTLASGSDGLEKMGRELQALGGVIDRDAARQIENANDAITRMSQSFSAASRDLAVTFAPTIEVVANAMSKLSSYVIQGQIGVLKMVRASHELQKNLPDWMTGGETFHEIAVEEMTREIERAEARLKELEKPFKVGADASDEISDNMGKAAEAAEKLEQVKALREAEMEGLDKVFEQLAEWEQRIDQLGMDQLQLDLDNARRNLEEMGAGRGQIAQIEAMIRKYHEMAGAIEDASEERERLAQIERDRASRAESIVESLRSPMDDYVERIEELATLVESGFLTAEQAAEAMQQARDDLPDPRRGDALAGAARFGTVEEFNIRQQLAAGERSAEAQLTDEAKKARQALIDLLEEVREGREFLEELGFIEAEP